jgi:hypothetical protein
MKSAPRPAGEELHRHAAPGPQPRAAARSPPRPARPWPTSRSWPCGATTRPPCTPTTASPPSAASRVKDMINDQDWNANTFLPTVGKRGAAIIEARGLSSAASAANAAIDHMRDWALGTNGKWVTMGIPSDGSYGIPKDDVRRACDLREWRIHPHRRPAGRRLQPRGDGQDPGRAGRRARRRGAPALIQAPQLHHGTPGKARRFRLRVRSRTLRAAPPDRTAIA